MQRLAAEFLTEKEQKKVTDTVQKAEKMTSGETVPMIVSTSGKYQMSAVCAGLLVVLPVTLLCTELLTRYLYLGSSVLYLFLALTVIGCVGLYYAMVKMNRMTTLRRHLLSAKDVDEEVKKSYTCRVLCRRVVSDDCGKWGFALYVRL